MYQYGDFIKQVLRAVFQLTDAQLRSLITALELELQDRAKNGKQSRQAGGSPEEIAGTEAE
jgi:hypothetical protein